MINNLNAVGRDVESLHHCLETADFGLHELDTFLHFEIGSYTRNLIYRNECYEMMAICWGMGHHTPIHDHNGQEGWIKVIDGTVEEALYNVQMLDEESFVAELIRADRFLKGSVSHVNDQIAYHSIRNINRGRSVTLHLYSLPISQCNIYDTKSGKRGVKIMSNYTEYGVKVS